MREVLTSYDVVRTCCDSLGLNSAAALRRIKEAMRSALHMVQNDCPSDYSLKHSRLRFVAPDTTGTVTYDHTGGTYERQLTLASSTWPSDVVDYSLLLDDLVCDVESRISDTVITLDLNLNPGADLAAGTTFTLYKRYYRLPDDFGETDSFFGEQLTWIGQYVTMGELLGLNRAYGETGSPRCYSIGGIPDQVGARGLFLYPGADETTTWDYIYRRIPREIRYTGHESNTATLTVDSTSTTVAASAATFTSAMVGSVIRISNTATAPTGLTGPSAWTDERLIHTYTDSTHVVVDRVPSFSGSGKGFVVTDPIDIDPRMYDLYQARCILELATTAGDERLGAFLASYREKLYAARCAVNANIGQSTSMQPQILGGAHVTIVTADAT